MLFNSYEFIFFFLPITFYIYFLLNKKGLYSYSRIFLVFSSLFFYSWWNVIYLPLILSSIFFNYIIGTTLSKSHEKNKTGLNKNFTKKSILIFGVFCNLLLLAYFKYTDFFLENFNGIFGSNIPLQHIILPLGISFFTFTQIAFLVDAYKNEVKEYDLVRYMLFVTYFPHLLAGPILHHKEMMPQFKDKLNSYINLENITKGIFIFTIGLFKKVVIADSFASYATNGFDVQEKLNFIEAWLTSLSYTFQLYYDFSGYSDMAIGIALLFNIKLPINFNSPYKASNVQDFWRRWHMTLSRFLRDYIYIPLGGNKVSEVSIYINLFITFLLAGIWHGAGWTFIFWAFLHALAIVCNRVWRRFNIKLNYVISWIITFNFINITWIFFRAKNFDDATKVLEGLVGLNGLGLESVLLEKFLIVGLFLTFLISILAKNSIELINNFKADFKTVVFLSLLFSISIIFLTRVSEFLYFDF